MVPLRLLLPTLAGTPTCFHLPLTYAHRKILKNESKQTMAQTIFNDIASFFLLMILVHITQMICLDSGNFSPNLFA